MRIIYTNEFPDNKQVVILIFGLGLIGESTSKLLENKLIQSNIIDFEYSWYDESKQTIDTQIILNFLVGLKAKIKPATVAIIWSAGKAGFGAGSREVNIEFNNFQKVFNLCYQVEEVFKNSQLSFHMVSSAGGLFEGERNVCENDKPSPKKYYGFLKLNQENYINTIPLSIQKIIYRPSSVYGVTRHGGRMGLIPTLILNGLRAKVTTIFGERDTIRDYIYVEDVSECISSMILNPLHYDSTITLANGKPSTIMELISKIEKLLHKKLYIRYVISDFNKSNNSYHVSSVFRGSQITPLDLGLRKVYMKLFGL